MDLKSREFFLQYSRQPKSFGIKPISHSFYELQRFDGSFINVRSMLSTHEIALLYSCAKHCWNGKAIVDLGPLSGASTWALAKGLMESESEYPVKSVINSFDLWRAESSYKEYLTEYRQSDSNSVLGHWIEVMEGFHHMVEPHQGDFCTWQWNGSEIGILFVDIAKSWDLNDHVVSTMFPCLSPGSILIQQDYIHWNEYWIHMEMARFSEFFEHCQFLRGATSVYKCIKSPPKDLCRVSLNSYSYSEQVELLEIERNRAPEPIKEVMKIAAAKHAMENNDFR